MRVHEPTSLPTDTSVLESAIRHHFAHRAGEAASNLRFLVSNGKRDLVVGFLFLFICGTLGLLAGQLLPPNVGKLVQEGFLIIVGWHFGALSTCSSMSFAPFGTSEICSVPFAIWTSVSRCRDGAKQALAAEAPWVRMLSAVHSADPQSRF